MKKIYFLLALTFLLPNVFAQTVTTYSVSGAYTYTVGSGVTAIAVDAVGGNGGNNSGSSWPSNGGKGGRVVCTLAVTGGQILYINVGGRGVNGTSSAGGTGGFNGGANGGAASGYGGGGGGGATDIRMTSNVLSNRVVVAGGAGGAGLNCVNTCNGGDGGNVTAANGNGCGTTTFPSSSGNGQGGSGSGGGGGGVYSSTVGGAGTLGNGGAGYIPQGGTGGGGGGYYGGGGAGGWAGAGGGSSFTNTTLCTSVTHTLGYNVTTGGDGMVMLTELCNSTGAITGASSLCVGATTTLANPTGATGGTWISNNTSIATIGSSTGIVTGITAGIAVITYSVNTPCGALATRTITVNALPATITGTTTVCTGVTTTLSSATSGGIWTSSNPSQATVGSTTGIVTGAAAGIPSITYTFNNCSAVANVTVNASPAAISGASTVCPALTTALTNATSGGVWSSSNTSFATVGSATGIVTGVTGGSLNILYTTSNGCSAIKPMTVNAISAISGILGVCTIGATSTLTNTASGGTWTSSNVGVATVGSSSGVVTSVSTGATTITYSMPSGCIATATFGVTGVPNVYTVTGGGAFCVGGAGVTVGLSNTDYGVSYHLMNGLSPVGLVISGSGFPANFPLTTTTGTLTVVANLGSSCQTAMSGSTTVSTNALPTIYSVTGGGNYCIGGTGVSVGLSSSTIGVNYQLYLNGTTMIGSPVAGTGASLNFGLQTAAGTYTVIATHATLGCVNNMSGSATVSFSALPQAFTVTGGGGFCSGGTGVPVGLSGSETGVNYQLYYAGVAVSGAVLTGTGSSLSFGSRTAGGLYTVVGTNASTGCTTTMTGSANVVVNVFPVVYTVTGGGAYCSGGTGVAIGLNGSEAGITYQLYRGTTSLVPMSGTGAALNFGLFTTAGSYTIVATNTTTGCSLNMSSSANVAINALPTAFAVTGGGSYCSGGTGVSVGLAGSAVGFTYQLWLSTTLVDAAPGTGSAIDFGFQTAAGFYTIVAIDNVTLCSATMTGSATVSINPLPIVRMVTGGGAYCAGGTGVAIGLDGSSTGTSYQLLSGITPSGTAVSGTGVPISFGLRTGAGSYTARATITATGCTTLMTSSAAIVINPLPTATSVTGTGSYCAGGTGRNVGLAGSIPGISYQLYRDSVLTGSSMPGTGAAIDFGLQTLAGSYTVVGTNTTTACDGGMTGNAIVTIDPLPVVYAVTGGGNYCSGSAGVTIGLGSSQTGVSYQLYNGVSASGAPVTGTGSSIDFGYRTIAGTYTVVATNITTGCVRTMSGSAAVGIWSLPAVFSITGGGNYCSGGAGVHIGLSASTPGINYQLYNASVPAGPMVAGTGAAIDFGLLTGAGTYTVRATNPLTSCFRTMTGSVNIVVDPLPNVYGLTGGGNYCFGTAGVHIGLSNSDAGINYQLNLGGSPVGAPTPGTGGSLDFGLQTATGTYDIVATNVATGCSSAMAGGTIVNIDPLPVFHNITGGGGYCPGGTGVQIGLDGSEIGFDYQLYKGGVAVGSPIAGTGIVLDFGMHTATGTYTIKSTNVATGCSVGMTGSKVVSVFPVPGAYTVTGTGNYCPATPGLNVGLSGSDLGVNYQLYNTGGPVGTAMTGTGLPLDFGSQLAGTYTVVATSTSTTCNSNMTGSAVIGIHTLPTVRTMTGGGSYCAGGTGVAVGLNGSDAGVNYQLMLGSSPTGTAVAGTGSAITFGMKTVAGVYTVVATNTTSTCSNNMTGSSVVVINALPTLYNVTGGGNYCSGGTGVHIYLSGSNTGISYQLMKGVTAVGAPIAGTGAMLNFGLITASGIYTVVATNTSSLCTANMVGSVTVGIDALPIAYTVSGGGNYCIGGTGLSVALSGSNTGVSYQLLLGGSPVGAAIPGTGLGLNFGTQTATGSYTIRATNTVTGCVNMMTGSVSIGTNPLPNVYSVSSTSSNYCNGGSGVLIALTGSDAGIDYQLYHMGTAVGSPVPGTGSAVNFGNHLPAGLYTAVAINATTGCTINMASSVTVVIDPLPTVYTITGGGGYCDGTPGVHVGLSSSTPAISYQLYLDGSATGSAVTGTGSAIDFGIKSANGSYTVVATNPATTCVNNMSGVANVMLNVLPAMFTMTGGGNYCVGGAGVSVGISGSQTGINYQLKVGGVNAGPAIAGTGSALDFGMQTTVGSYTVVALNTSTGCTRNMLGAVSVGTNAAPAAYPVIGGGNYCAGGVGVHVGLSSSQAGVSYQLYNGGAPVGSPMAASGPSIDFGLQTGTGAYTVVGTNTATGCTSNMSGSATVGTNALPTLYNVMGGGSYCSGTAGVHVGMNGSTIGVNYQLYNGFTAIGLPVAGTGAVLDFGAISTPATYTVIATNTTTACSRTMAGSATVTMNPSVTPAVSISTASGDTLCAGSFTTFTATPVNGGMSPAYQWKVNGANTGTSSTFSYIPANGDVLSVTLTSSAACAAPTSVTKASVLNVMAPGAPAITVTANPGTQVCEGTSVTYVANAVFGGTSPSYTWVKNGATVGFASTFAYTPADGDDIYCLVLSNYRCRTANSAMSSHVIMTVDAPVNPTVAISTTPGLNLAAGQTVMFTANVLNGGTTPSFQWLVNGIVVPGANMQTYSTNTLANMDVVSCQVMSSSACAGMTGTGSATVSVSGTGVNTISAISNVSLMPNPNKGIFTVKGSVGVIADEEVSLEVTNMLGQVMYSSKVTARNGELNERVELGKNLANGMYILNLRSGTESKVFHMVIEQ